MPNQTPTTLTTPNDQPMTPSIEDIKNLLVRCFTAAGKEKGVDIESFEFQDSEKKEKNNDTHHTAFPKDKTQVAVYMFQLKSNGKFLKIGQTTDKARFCSDHYSVVSTESNLAQSLFLDGKSEMMNTCLSQQQPGCTLFEWVKKQFPKSTGKELIGYLKHGKHEKEKRYDYTNGKSKLNQDFKEVTGEKTLSKWVKDWINENCRRINIMIPANTSLTTKSKQSDKFLLNFTEGLLHYVYEPRYEYKATRKKSK